MKGRKKNSMAARQAKFKKDEGKIRSKKGRITRDVAYKRRVNLHSLNGHDEQVVQLVVNHGLVELEELRPLLVLLELLEHLAGGRILGNVVNVKLQKMTKKRFTSECIVSE